LVNFVDFFLKLVNFGCVEAMINLHLHILFTLITVFGLLVMTIELPTVEALIAMPTPLRIDEDTANKAIKLAGEADPEFKPLIEEYSSQLYKFLQGTLSKDEDNEIEWAIGKQYPNVIAFSSLEPQFVEAFADDASQCTMQYVSIGVDVLSIILSLLGVGGAKGALKAVVLKNVEGIEKLAPLFKALASAKSKMEQASTAAKIVVGVIGVVGYAGIKEAIGHMSAWEWIKFAATLAGWVASGGAAIAVEIFNLGAALYGLVDDTLKLKPMGCV
jgi:hypothetical protein